MTESIQADLNTAEQTGNLNNVLVKNLNMWQKASEDQFIDPAVWKANEIEPIDIDGKSIYFGGDFSRKNDLSSISWLVPLDDGTYYADSYSFVGGGKHGIKEKMHEDAINYEALADAGECEITTLPGGVVDQKRITEYLINMIETHNLKPIAVGVDPYNADFIIHDLDAYGLEVREISQGVRTLSQPISDFRDQLLLGKIKHAPNRLLEIATNNAVITYNDYGNPLLDKHKYVKRFDPVAALLDAFAMIHYDKLNESELADNGFYASSGFSF